VARYGLARLTALFGCYGTDSSTSTQSSNPLLFVPADEKVRVPLAGNGDPLMVLKVPFAGSYHRATTFGPLSCERFAVTEVACGR